MDLASIVESIINFAETGTTVFEFLGRVVEGFSSVVFFILGIFGI